MLRRFFGLASLTCLLVACGIPAQQQDPARLAAALAPQSPILIELPASAEAWRASLESDARELQQLLDRTLVRWPRSAGGPLRLVVLPSPQQSVEWCARAGLPGDARVPRTHTTRRIAVVPLVREDRLMTGRAVPPRTLRETLRHEMVHLLVLDRPGLEKAPRWFHEGLAEAWVSLREIDRIDASSHAMGACWEERVRQRASEDSAVAPAAEAHLHSTVASMPSELRYTAWAELVLRLLASSSSERPWEAAEANPRLAEFFEASAPIPDQAPNEASLGLPLARGRDIDFVPEGRSVLLVAGDGDTVGLSARLWHGFEAFQLRARVGQSGEPLAEILLGAIEGEQLVRIRLNGNGGIVAAWEGRERPIQRAFRDRLPVGALNRWRDLEIRTVRREEVAYSRDLGAAPYGLLIQSGAYQSVLPLPAGSEPRPGAPWLLEFRVRSGAFEVVGESPLVAALR